MKKSKSGFIGVCKVGNRFKAQIDHDHKKIHLGVFDTAEEAARYRDKAAIRLKGESAILNFAIGQPG